MDTSTRTGPSDFRVGDLIKFRLEDLMSPYGDVVLETRATLKSPAKDDVSRELLEAFKKRVGILCIKLDTSLMRSETTLLLLIRMMAFMIIVILCWLSWGWQGVDLRMHPIIV